MVVMHFHRLGRGLAPLGPKALVCDAVSYTPRI